MNKPWWRRWQWLVLGMVCSGAIAFSFWDAPRQFVTSGAMFSPSAAISSPLKEVTPDTPVELRGVWLTNIDSGVLFSPIEIRYGLQRLAKLNFNTIYPTMWNWGYTLYPSNIAQATLGEAIDPHGGFQNRDPLQELVTQSHALGLTVMPWFEFGLMTPSYSELARRHPSWIGQRQDGTSVIMQGRHPRKWLNPLHPGVQAFLVDLITEVVQNYDVDGIQLDDHFGMPVELGYDSYTIAYYQETHEGQDPPQ